MWIPALIWGCGKGDRLENVVITLPVESEA